MSDLQLIVLRKENEQLRQALNNFESKLAVRGYEIQIEDLKAELAHYKDEWRVAKEYVIKRCGNKGSTSILRLALREMCEENDQLRVERDEWEAMYHKAKANCEKLYAELAEYIEQYGNLGTPAQGAEEFRQLRAELDEAKRRRPIDEPMLKGATDTAKVIIDELRAELAEAKRLAQTLYEVGRSGIYYVAAANYVSREIEAIKRLDDVFNAAQEKNNEQ